MNKSLKIILILLPIILVLLALTYIYFVFYHKSNYDNTIIITNPVVGLTDQQAIEQFDESFVEFLLVSIGAQSLHNPPLSSNTPKIEIQLEDTTFSAEVKERLITVSQNSIEDKDIIIRTTKAEAVKMLRDEEYIKQSFLEGSSTVELIASKTTLFTKGYLKIYTDLTGETVE